MAVYIIYINDAPSSKYACPYIQDARCLKFKPRERAFKQFKSPVLNALRMSSNPLISLMSRSIWPDFEARMFVVEFYVLAITEPLSRHHRFVDVRESGVSLACLHLVSIYLPLCPPRQGLLYTLGFLSSKSSFTR